MNRSLLVPAVLVLAVAAGCGGSDDDATPKKQTASATPGAASTSVLELSRGSVLTISAPNAQGVVSTRTPVALKFRKVTCTAKIPGVGFDDENRNVDLVAGKGKRLCLVELAVTNVGRKKNFFTSRDIAELRTTDGRAYPQTRKTYDYQAIADERGRELASTADLIRPGRTKDDYAIYEVPDGAKPQAVVYSVVEAG